MQISSRQKVSFAWKQAEKIAEHIGIMDSLGDSRREQYSTLVLIAAASSLRCGELLALKGNDIDFDLERFEWMSLRTKGTAGR